MVQHAPGKHFRKGISITEMMRMFPDDETAEAWFVKARWPNGIHCPSCGSLNVQTGASHKMPFRCRERQCRKRFSVKTGTVMQASNLGCKTWGIALYLALTSLKSVSSMKLHRDLDITQKSAWHLAHRIRKALTEGDASPFAGPVEVDETYMGGRERNKHSKDKLKAGRGTVGKTAVVGVRDRATNDIRAQVVEKTDAKTLQGFVRKHTAEDATVYTDEARAYVGIDREHGTVNHGVGKYVDDQIHVQGMESFWSMLKRAHKGTFHKISAKHLQMYASEFAGRHNFRDQDTAVQMATTVLGMDGKRLKYRDLIAENGLSSGARPAKVRSRAVDHDDCIPF